MDLPKPGELVPITKTSPKTLVIYGAPKVGKSTLGASLPTHLLLDLEDGSDYLEATKVKITNIFQITALEKAVIDAKKPYKFGVVDTLTTLEDWCEREATRKYKASIIGSTFKGESVLELPKGAGYLHLRNEYYSYFHRIRQLFEYTIYIGHVRDSVLAGDGANKAEVSAKDIDLTGKVKNITCSYADAIGRLYRNKEQKLVMSFATSDTANCGSRCKHLAGKEFTFSNPATIENWRQIYVDI